METHLDSWLRAHPDALLAALSESGRIVPMPASVELHGQRVFPGRVAMEAFVPEDRATVIATWMRAHEEPMASVPVHLVADPEHQGVVHFFDTRADHGVHVVALECDDPALVLDALGTLDGTQRRVAHVGRDAASVFVEVDDATTELLGWSRDELIGVPTLEFIHPDDVDGAIEHWIAMRASGGEDLRTNVRLRHKDGHYVWLEVTNTNLLDDPEVGCVRSRLVDISGEMAELAALHGRERLVRRLADALPIGMCHLRPDGQVMYANPPLGEVLGPIDSLDGLVNAVAGIDRGPLRVALDRALGGLAVDLEVGVLRDYEERRCELTLRALPNDAGGIDGVLVCATDVTDRSRLRSELEHRATHDALSGCLNRAATVVALERALRGNPHVVVAYIDLDHFKTVNDELGHAAGDEVLRVTAARLRHVIRSHDRLGRIGGDEFAVICPQAGTPFEMKELVDRLTDAIGNDVVFAKHRIHIRASVGAAMSQGDEIDAEGLLSRADAAMYEAKHLARRGDQPTRIVAEA